jgi:hypothetical protein
MYMVQRPIVTTHTHSTCGFHERHPGHSFPGCTCSSGYSSREKTDAEMTDDERRGYYAALRGERPDGSPLFA